MMFRHNDNLSLPFYAHNIIKSEDGFLLQDYTAQQPRTQPSSYSPPWEPEISHNSIRAGQRTSGDLYLWKRAHTLCPSCRDVLNINYRIVSTAVDESTLSPKERYIGSVIEFFHSRKRAGSTITPSSVTQFKEASPFKRTIYNLLSIMLLTRFHILPLSPVHMVDLIPELFNDAFQNHRFVGSLWMIKLENI
jgi:hypothetical protein